MSAKYPLYDLTGGMTDGRRPMPPPPPGLPPDLLSFIKVYEALASKISDTELISIYKQMLSRVTTATEGNLPEFTDAGDFRDSGVPAGSVMRKVTSALAGNFAIFSSGGGVVDSGIRPAQLQTKLTFDDYPTQGSVNPVKSNGVWARINTINETLQAHHDEIHSGINSTLVQKLAGIAAGAQVNVIEGIKVNGTSQTVVGKTVDITVPTTAGEVGAYTKSEVNTLIEQAKPSDYDTYKGKVNVIEGKIPEQASAQNQLADKAFVNSSIATNTAFYISDGGRPFQSLADLETYEGTLTNNDYAFVVGRDTAGNTTYTRYKWNEATETWGEEYVLNNSSFTAEQWAAINSGITSALVTKLGALPTAEQLAAALLAKYEKPSTGIPKTDLAAGVQASLDKADTALQTAPVTSVNNKTGAVSLSASDVGALGNTGEQNLNGLLRVYLNEYRLDAEVLLVGSKTYGLGLNQSQIIFFANGIKYVIDVPAKDGTLALLENIAPAFSTSATYEVNKLCVHANTLYRCTTAITTAGAWDSSKWTAATVQDVLAALWAALGDKAPLESPAFTGTPTAPTPASGDDSTKVATTAFVQAAISNAVAAAVAAINYDYFMRVNPATGAIYYTTPDESENNSNEQEAE